MTLSNSFYKTTSILKSMLIADIAFLFVMSIFRTVFFFRFADFAQLEGYGGDVFHAFLLGVRFDLSVIGYVQLLAFLILVVFYILKKERLFVLAKSFFLLYFFVMFTLVSYILASDAGFYSYFQDHINILIFGIMDDDTVALWNTLLKNRA